MTYSHAESTSGQLGIDAGWFNPALAEGRWFPQRAAQVKNIWVPYEESSTGR